MPILKIVFWFSSKHLFKSQFLIFKGISGQIHFSHTFVAQFNYCQVFQILIDNLWLESLICEFILAIQSKFKRNLLKLFFGSIGQVW